MIITCAECTTQFQLDEERIPATGIRVRCSVCKHSFFQGHPDALDGSDADPVDRVVQQVLDREPGAVPQPTEDLGAPEVPATRAGPSEDGLEGSWEFSDGGRLSDASSRDRFEESFEAAREAVDDLLGSPWQPPENPLQASPEVALSAEPLAASEPANGPALEDPGDALPETPARWDEIALPDEDSGPSPLGLSDDPWDTGPDWANEAAPTVAAASGAAVDRDPEPVLGAEPSAVISDLHGPDEVDSFGSELGDREDPGSPASDLSAADELELDDGGDPYDGNALAEALDALDSASDDDLGSFEDDRSADAAGAFALDAPDTRDDESLEDFALGDLLAGPDLAGSAPTTAEPLPIGLLAPSGMERHTGRALAWLASAGSGLGWGAVAVLAAAALWGSVAPRTAPARASGTQALAGLEATRVAGRWVENAHLGALYVVSGELHNPGPETRIPAARLVVRLLDAQGAPIREAAAVLGRPLGAPLLREARAEALRDAGELGALDLARMPVAPGARIAFEAVVVGMPDAARRFELAASPLRAKPPAGS